jgi:signal transduction histidine kinase
MVNGVLDFSKMEAGRFDLSREPLDLRVLLSEVVDQMSDYGLQRGVAIELALANSEASCQLEGLRIRQVMLNLLTNAIKFSEPGTTVFVRWQRDAAVDRIEVQDRGIGIAPENHERVFASFEQVHKGDTRRYGGSGLGLSISRSLVRMHGGELSVESALGVGSTFTFTLPREAVSSSDAPAA